MRAQEEKQAVVGGTPPGTVPGYVFTRHTVAPGHNTTVDRVVVQVVQEELVKKRKTFVLTSLTALLYYKLSIESN